MNEIETLFAPKGALASLLKGYRPRESQQLLAQAVADNLDDNSVLLAEAGTGTGKTFAYLLPAIYRGKKTLVSTATKTLQEQIFTHDIPLVKKGLKSGVSVALLKGRRNYFCHYHYAQLQSRPLLSAEDKTYRLRIDHFAKTTKDGDLVNLKNIPEDHEIIQHITSTTDNCLGRECEFFEECFVQKARQKAKEADLVVVNHHLLLADFALKSDGFAEILPDIEAFIIDEAHHLPQIAVNFLGERVSQRQIRLFLDDLNIAVAEEAPDALDLRAAISPCALALAEVINSLKETKETHYESEELLALAPFWKALKSLSDRLYKIKKQFSPHHERGKQLHQLSERLGKMLDILALFIDRSGNPVLSKQTVEAASVKAVAENLSLSEKVDITSSEQAESEKKENSSIFLAQWLDVGQKSFVLNSVPVNAAGRFAYWIKQSGASWTFLSATLAVGGKFDHFRRELGLSEQVSTLQLESPFDYRMQSLLYHPQNLPNPNENSYTKKLIEASLPVLKRTKGRAFLLFTSYKAMHTAKEVLKDERFQLFVQGDAPKAQLLADFRESKQGLLLATASFWEGVDVRGDRLVCVVIDRLPFAVPNDPVTKTRHRLLEEKGLSPFIHDSLPQAVISLKQGVGRLIRDVEDYGVLVIGDPRLTGKRYGKIFLESLPRMTRTTKLDIVNRFFDYHEQS
ncbi:ATP-dependent DNA helicase [Suttonella ornithocola]|uniref:DNA 5'-3' helicase n=1 Tax=Suttonella ornithocola TaxID=279832 RepID=A0A380MTK1_9GAMM|nr:ATP-dependent DNA helicase [Suttonella ornithocola]SUO95396.1 Probable ATP-dependent helicase dinG homolog [Suttonella ornithocola]